MATERSPSSSVRSLEVVLTTSCNLRCAYCFQDVRSERSMSWGVLRSALDLLLSSDHPKPELTFSGGEPLLELPLITRSVEYLESERGGRVAVSVFTNGTLLDRGTSRFLARRKIATQISFDGIEPAQELRAPGTFGRLDRVLSLLGDEHPEFLRDHCSVAITLSSQNLEYLAESFADLVDRGVGEIVVSAVVTHDAGWLPDTLDALVVQIEEILHLTIRHFRSTGEVPFAAFRQAEADDSPPPDPTAMCSAAGTSSLAVDVDGRVYGCVLFAESYQTIPDGLLRRCLGPMRLGDIRARSFGARLEGYSAAAAAAKIFTDKEAKYSSYRTCRGCRYVNQCSVCPFSIGHIRGNADPNRVPDLQCALNLAVLAARDRFLEELRSERGASVSATV